MTRISFGQPGPSSPKATEDAQRPAHAPRQVAASPPESAAFDGLTRRPAQKSSIEDVLRRQSARIRPVPEEQLPLAAYLLDRGLGGRPVHEEDVARLRLADKAVRHTRHTFSYGRGNVDVDIRKSHRDSEVRASAMWSLFTEKDRAGTKIIDDDANGNYYALCAMTGKVFRAGVCDNYAATAAFSYGTMAQDAGRPSAEQVQLMAHKRTKHVWAEVATPDAQSSNVVMDAWSEGPPVLAEDSRFANDRARVFVNASFHLSDAAKIDKRSDRDSSFLRECEEDMKTRIAQAKRDVLSTPGNAFQVWSPQPVLGDDFVARMRDRRQTSDPWGPVRAEMHAIAVARSLGVERVPNVLADVPRFFKAAQSLAEAGGQAGWPSSSGHGQSHRANAAAADRPEAGCVIRKAAPRSTT